MHLLRIVIYSVLFIEMLVAISQAISFQVRVKDVHAINRQIIISGAFSLQCMTCIAMQLNTNETVRYVLYTGMQAWF